MKSITTSLIAVFSLFTIQSCNDEKIEKKVYPCIPSTSLKAGSIVPDRYIISLPAEAEDNGGRKESTAIKLLQRHAVSEEKVINQFQGRNNYLVMKLTSSEAEKLRKDEDVQWIEQDRTTSACSCIEIVSPDLLTWNVLKVGYGDGTGKTAWVVDSGVDLDHPDLVVDAEKSRTFMPDGVNADDDFGHGTHIAGIIGGKNNSIGVLGVASGATIVGLKVLDSKGDGLVSYTLDALSYIAQFGKAGDVVNLSLEVDAGGSDILDEEVRALGQRGIFVAMAAGNSSRDASEISPARANGTNVYTVSAVDSLDHWASWSNFGNGTIDFAAPGVNIISTYKDGEYAKISGTSQATPHVAGILLVNNGKINRRGNVLDDPDGASDPLASR